MIPRVSIDRLVERFSDVPVGGPDRSVRLWSRCAVGSTSHRLDIESGRLVAWATGTELPDGWILEVTEPSLVATITRHGDDADLATEASVVHWAGGRRRATRPLPPFDVDLPLPLVDVAGADATIGFHLTGSPWGRLDLEVVVHSGTVVQASTRSSLISDLDLTLTFDGLEAYLRGDVDVYEMLDAGVEIDGELDDLELVIGLIESEGARSRFRERRSSVGETVSTLGALLADVEVRSLARHDLADQLRGVQ